MKVEEYQAYIKEDIFPKGVSSLDECKSAEEIVAWRELIVK
jgi:hypothetical protein